MALEQGDKIDRYSIIAHLGAGGMGVVYRAYDPRLERHVALKILFEHDADSTDGASSGRARMIREARTAAALEHPNVVAIYDVVEAQEPEALRGTTYLTMELIDGRPLRSYIGDPAVSIERRVEWLASVARALDAAHGRGLIHRDVKPGNVMVRSDGLVKVLDFGIAKRYASVVDPRAATEAGVTTTGGTIVGTPAYMAPEQLKKEALDGRCDQFAWGVMAYELLSGKRPWRSEGDAMHLVAEILSFEPPALGSVAPDVPARVSAAVMRALAKTPASRFASMSDVVGAIEGSGTITAPEIASGALPMGPSAERAAEPASRTGAGVHVASKAPATGARRGPLAPGAMVAVGIVVAAVAGLAAYARSRPFSAEPKAAPSVTITAPECTTRAACVDAHHGEAWMCRPSDGKCVALAAEGCEVLAQPGDLRDESTVWVGVIVDDPATRAAADLARKDFAALSQVRLADGRSPRPLSIVSCDGRAPPRTQLDHLVKDVGIAAAIGFSSSEEAMELVSEVLAPQGVLSLVSMNPAAQITAIPSPAGKPRLVWRTTNDTTATAEALSMFVSAVLEPKRRQQRTSPAPFRVAVLRPPTVAGVGFSDAIVSSLHLNGASVAANPLDYSEAVVSPEAPEADLEIRRRALLESKPDVVLYFGGDLFEKVLRSVESAWPAGALRPWYLSALPFDNDILRAGLPERGGLRKRMFAVTTPANTDVNAKFTLHYDASFGEKLTPDLVPNTTYDAFYVIAYALRALGERPVDGASLASQFEHLRSGKKVEVGPARILEGLGALAASGTIDLVGASSDLALDPLTGESPVDQVVLCVGARTDGTLLGMESGVRWRADTGSLSGALRCP